MESFVYYLRFLVVNKGDPEAKSRGEFRWHATVRLTKIWNDSAITKRNKNHFFTISIRCTEVDSEKIGALISSQNDAGGGNLI